MLVNYVVSNNIYSIIIGYKRPKRLSGNFERVLKFFIRLVAAIIPILSAFGIANIIDILKYAGTFGFINIFFPIMLQLRSIYVCESRFLEARRNLRKKAPTYTENGDLLPPYYQKLKRQSEDNNTRSEKDSMRLLSGEENKVSEEEGRISDNEKDPRNLLREIKEENGDSRPILSKRTGERKEEKSLHMTPYSLPIVSSPMFVCIMGTLGAVFMGFALASTFIELKELKCKDLAWPCVVVRQYRQL